MKVTHRFAALAACAALALPVAAPAAGPYLRIPDFSHLHSKAIDSVDITLDGFLLNIARKFAAADGDKDPALALLSSLKSVRVRNFEFDTDGAYSREDVESVRKQLSEPGWSALAQVQKRDPKSKVDVFINTVGERILGLAVVASEPRSFTIVSIVGDIDVDKVHELAGKFTPATNEIE